MNTIYTHRSIRSFSPEPIPEVLFNKIIEGACRASNTGNMQLYSIIASTEQSIKDELCERAHFNQKMVKEAPLVLTFCADLQRFTQWCNLRNADPGYNNFLSFYTATVDTVIAAQNACVAAEAEGLGICYLGTTNYCADAIIEILNLPELVVPVTTVVVGFPAEKPEQTDRLPHSAIVHSEKYKKLSNQEVIDQYSFKENSEIYHKFVKESNVSNLAEVFTKKRYTKENNVLFSEKLLQTLKKQNFLNND